VNEQDYRLILEDLCLTIGLTDVDGVIATRTIEVEGFDVRLDYFENDPDALYMIFNFGTVTAGRTLNVFQLMLEANLTIYAQDQAQLGIDPDSITIVLLVRLEASSQINGEMLADLMAHYADHGRYWRKNIIESSDEMFEGIAFGSFIWLRV
jgi:Tir chaperone protein (CesT) family